MSLNLYSKDMRISYYHCVNELDFSSHGDRIVVIINGERETLYVTRCFYQTEQKQIFENATTTCSVALSDKSKYRQANY